MSEDKPDYIIIKAEKFIPALYTKSESGRHRYLCEHYAVISEDKSKMVQLHGDGDTENAAWIAFCRALLAIAIAEGNQ